MGKNDLSRREFVEILGGSFAALTFAGCDFSPPDEKIIPYLVKPDEVTPGLANWYASTCGSCPAACGLLVKSRDGRPIKMEGNPEHPLSMGGLCARGQAGVLDLYDSERLKGPLSLGAQTSWSEVDSAIIERLGEIKSAGGRVVILSPTIVSPTAGRAIAEFAGAYPTASHVVYDPISYHAILEAHKLCFGKRTVPWYRFEKAKVIVGFDADFLGTWISPVEFAAGWALNRKLTNGRKTMSWHAQFEARMSITGANADQRTALPPSRQLPAVIKLARLVAKRLDQDISGVIPAPDDVGQAHALLTEAAEKLVEAKGYGLVVSGSADLNVQLVVNYINHVLGNYGSTLDIERPSLQCQGDDHAMNMLIDDMGAGKVSALILYDSNPSYNHPRADEFRKALGKVALTVSLAPKRDETSKLVQYQCPDHHFLESWGDAAPRPGIYSLYQPLIAPMYNTRSAVESFLAWSGVKSSAYDYLRKYWSDNIFTKQDKLKTFDEFWNKSLHDGVAILLEESKPAPRFDVKSLSQVSLERRTPAAGKYELVLYPSAAVGDGRHANNPWLQELPDPITKVTWGNYASVSARSAKELKVVEGRIVRISAGNRSATLPVLIQPGMPDHVVAAALGYGRTDAGKIAANYPVGKKKEPPLEADVYPFVGVATVSVEPTDSMAPLAKTQTYDYSSIPFTGEKRAIVRESTLNEYQKDPHSGNDDHHSIASMWPLHEYKGHKWAMAIDLNSCTGCSACVVACQAENNVPVVGRAEILARRELHWMRIDRYYSGSDGSGVGFLPMLCVQCDNAPCETVCPVLATLHSAEGLNMQAYNRCVGTRYCANNCPYKVRRFNWFDYSRDDKAQNLVLNPDVVVRTRGVMEKCTFCVQRLAEGKGRAKQEGRKLRDSDVQPACAQSCPSKAIIFGDVNDPDSQIAKTHKDPRSYQVLGEVGTRPAVNYLTKIRNRKA